MCHINIFGKSINGKNQIDYKLKITGTKLTITKLYKPNWLWPQNVESKMVFCHEYQTQLEHGYRYKSP